MHRHELEGEKVSTGTCIIVTAVHGSAHVYKLEGGKARATLMAVHAKTHTHKLEDESPREILRHVLLWLSCAVLSMCTLSPWSVMTLTLTGGCS